jgi:signal transduction histidine kinase
VGIQKFVLGDRVLETESEKRKIILGAYLILIYVGVDLFFLIVNLWNDEGKPLSLFIGFIVSTLCLFLLRWGKVDLAIIIHLIRGNALAFYFSSLDFDPLQTGSYFYFIPSSLGALAVFGYRQRWLGIGFTVLSFILFLIAIFKPSDFNPNHAHFYLIISFLIVLTIGILIIIFFDRMVTNSEKNILRKNKELIKVNQELDRFVYSASHDLRAPLSSMAGLIHLAQRDQHDAQVYLSLMGERVKVMDNYIKDIVEYSRNTRLEVSITLVNLKLVVEEVVNTLKYSIDSSKILIEININSGLRLRTDESRLRVILNNLISNAFKYMAMFKDQPRLTIYASTQGDRCIIGIEDNGIGIKPEHQVKIFGMFYRANDSVQGSGLGLYIAKETAEKLNGKISFVSVFGEGTTFTISLPA